jgi:hypothetical protein
MRLKVSSARSTIKLTWLSLQGVLSSGYRTQVRCTFCDFFGLFGFCGGALDGLLGNWWLQYWIGMHSFKV